VRYYWSETTALDETTALNETTGFGLKSNNYGLGFTFTHSISNTHTFLNSTSITLQSPQPDACCCHQINIERLKMFPFNSALARMSVVASFSEFGTRALYCEVIGVLGFKLTWLRRLAEGKGPQSSRERSA
jgi:hypothetical protein